MSRFDQRWVSAPEKITTQESRRDAQGSGGAIRGPLCRAVAGMSTRQPMS